MKMLALLGLLLAGSAAAQTIKADLVKIAGPALDLKFIDKRLYLQPIKTIKTPYVVSLLAPGNTKTSAGSCTMEYKGIVLAHRKFEGQEKFQFKGTFALNDGVDAVLLRCQLDGYEPLTESMPLVDNQVNVEYCFNTRKIFQEPVVDLEQGMARVRLQIPKFREHKVWLNGRTFVQLSSEQNGILSGSYTGEPLLPELPLTNFFFALPLDAQVTGITVKPGPIIGGLNLPLIPKAEEGSTQFAGVIPPRFDEKIYFSEKAEVSVQKDSRFQSIIDREQNLVKVMVPLVDFSASKSNIQYYDSIEVIVRFKSQSPCFRTPFRGRDAVDLYRAQQLIGLNQFILNPRDVLQACRNRSELRMSRAAINSSGPNLVIVAPREFSAEAERLRLHKETLGIRTAVLSWNEGSAAELKEKLSQAANHLRPNFMQWLLLLGDVDRIPTYYDTALGDPKHGDYALSAGDVYYTQIPLSPEVYTPSLDPKFSIGRIPAKTTAELSRVIDRIINYENNPPTVDYYYQSPTITATLQMTASQDIGTANNYAEFMENNISQRYFRAGFRPERIFRTDTEQALKPGYWSPSKLIDYENLTRSNPEFYPQLLFHMEGSQDLIDSSVKRGTSLLINRGHATTSNWAWPGFGYDSQRFSLYPTDKPPVVFAIACLTGFFDSETIHQGNITSERSEFQTADPNARYLAEQMLLDAHGALGVVAASRQSKWAYNNRLTLGLGRSLIDRETNGLPLSQRLGDVMVDAKVFAKKITGSIEEAKFLENTNRHHLLVYNLLGDPSVEIRQSAPLRIQGQPTVSYDAETMSLRLRFRMTAMTCPGCDLSQQKEQPLAVLMDANGGVVQRAMATVISTETGENREIVLNAVSSFYGNYFKIYISNAGLIPYQHVIDNRIR